MKDEINRIVNALFFGRSCKTLGLVLGMVFGAAILLIGFWRTAFIFACGSLGLWVGAQIDRGEDMFEKIERFLPDRYRRFR